MVNAQIRSPRKSSGLSDNGDVVHARMGQQVGFHLLSGDLLPSPFDLVLGSALDDEVSGPDLAGDVTGAVEAVRGERGPVVLLRPVVLVDGARMHTRLAKRSAPIGK